MRSLRFAALLLAGALGLMAQAPDAEQSLNVNGRYLVESVEVSGIDHNQLSRTLREDMQALVGYRLDESRLERLLRRLVRDFPEYTVTRQVMRGAKPDHVKIVYELKFGARRDRFNISARRAHFHSRLGWSGDLEATVRVKDNAFSAGVFSTEDMLAERTAGVAARYENQKVGSNRVRLAFDFESTHPVWDAATEQTLARSSQNNEIYRTRQNFQPAVTLVLARPLKLTVGTSFQRFQKQFPAAKTEAANAVIGTLRYDRLLESSGPNTHRLGAGYGLRAATKTLDSDYVYARHSWDAEYSLWRGPNRVTVEFTAGAISGHAPLFERFVLGNSQTLRGWSKYDVAPAGGDRVAHNSVEYRYRSVRVFYDVGTVWSRGTEASAKHSGGVGLQLGDLAFLVAFPMKSGRAIPVFMAGLNL